MDNQNNGWVSIYRKLLDNEIFIDKPDKWLKIWIYILLSVNHQENQNKDGYRRGERFFKSEWIQEKCNATSDQVKKCMSFLKSSTMISTSKSTRGMIIKVLKYDEYQDNEKIEAPVKAPTQAPRKHQRSTTINNNDNNENNDITINNTISSKTEVLQENKNDINNLIELFKDVNITYEKIFSNKTERSVLERFIKKWGYKKTENGIKWAIENQDEFTAITKPTEFERNVNKIILKKKTSKTNNLIQKI
jgi:hypothetical protein